MFTGNSSTQETKNQEFETSLGLCSKALFNLFILKQSYLFWNPCCLCLWSGGNKGVLCLARTKIMGKKSSKFVRFPVY